MQFRFKVILDSDLIHANIKVETNSNYLQIYLLKYLAQN